MDRLPGIPTKMQLDDLQSRISRVRTLVAAGKITETRSIAIEISAMAQNAHSLTTGPAWRVAAHVPLVGKPPQVTRETTTVTNPLGNETIAQLVRVATMVDPNRLRGADGSIRLAPLTRRPHRSSGRPARCSGSSRSSIVVRTAPGSR